ncbi:hypothetical protein DSL72_001138 [Monilinia vaccinii-corymbosi]|uniref:Gag1-like clamp domain-containing protein n=1 Tax=Monilinia vaccinii-corymbosi TaxID=61207 RepID=A0A8A3P7C7_9HELO|nr:hypothetical protein DSL72_001138 [Monilinia vaccinii-corymbosi]
MSQDLSAGVVDPPIVASTPPRHDPSSLSAISDTEVTAANRAKMDLESSTIASPILDKVHASSSDKEESDVPEDCSKSDTDPVLHGNPNVGHDASNLVIDAATTGGDGGTVNAENSSSGKTSCEYFPFDFIYLKAYYSILIMLASQLLVAPPISVVRPLENTNPSTETQPPMTTIQDNLDQHCQPSISSASANPQASIDNVTATSSTIIPNEEMNVVKVKANRRRMARVNAHPNALTVYEAELTSKDRATQKEAVRQYLEKRVRQDWDWVWPSEETAPIDIIEALVTEPSADDPPNPSTDSPTDKEEWRQRDEWESDPSESESENPTSPKGPVNINSPDKESPFRFESPDGVGQMVKQRRAARRRRHKKKLAAEIEWNTGVHCYVERRDAWTCARHVPPPTGRESWGIENLETHTNGNSCKAVGDLSDSEGWDTEVPIAKSLLPPDNAMRASITPQAYSTIYDKVILQSLTPSCPINLSDVIQSCVQGWKRDGEWPPTSSVPEPSLAAQKKQRRLSMLNILGLNQPQIPEAKAASPVAEKSPPAPSAIKKGLQKFWKRGDKVKGGPDGRAGA